MDDVKARFPLLTLLTAGFMVLWPDPSGLAVAKVAAQGAQQTATQATQEAWPDTEVIVKGKVSISPALWRIQKGDAQIIILGTLPVFPKSQAWNTKRVENALRGARSLITPPNSNPGFFDMMGLLSKKALPGRQLLKNVLTPELNARYEETARRAGVDIRDFAHDKPVWAGARLRRVVLQRRGLSDEEPLATVVRLAHRADVPVKAAGKYKIGPIFKDVNAMDVTASQACLSFALDDIDFDLDRAPRAATAWAQGDIRTVRANYEGSALMKCLSGSDQAALLNERSTSDAMTAVTEALSTPGKTVAVLPLAMMLRKGGVLERLRSQGYSVSNPED